MPLSRSLSRLTWALLPLALLATTWLYLYPLFHGCAFPQPHSTSLPLESSRAPFRLLALGDPQLEGDSSLPDPDAPVFPSVTHVIEDIQNANYDARNALGILATAARGTVTDLAVWLEGVRKMIDLWGNDWYLAHIVRSLRWWTEPTHVAVLGDLLGSQWITDGEFEKRAGRYWGTVMRGMERVPDDVMGVRVESDFYDVPEQQQIRTWGGTREVLGENEEWEKRVINIVGNHDIGYAGDIDEARVERFERAFGAVNWDIWFTLPNSTSTTSSTTDNEATTSPTLRLVILNTMNLDTPAHTPSLQDDTYSFLNHLITTSLPVGDKTHATLLLTHIPLHKPAGLCADAPYFDFFEGGSGIREQNMLSEYGSRVVLENLFGFNGNPAADGGGYGRKGVVVNGHDHVGCDTLHYIPQAGSQACPESSSLRSDAIANETQHTPSLDDMTTNTTTDDTDNPEHPWRASLFPPPNSCATTHPSLREITLRSMMGDYSGYAGFLSAWFDDERGERGEWVFEFNTCGVGVQHWWWAVHGLDLLVMVGAVAAFVAGALERRGSCGKGKKGSKLGEAKGRLEKGGDGLGERKVRQTR